MPINPQQTHVRLSPELQAEYQQIHNDPAQKGSGAWLIATKGLVAAGLIEADPTNAAMEQALEAAESNTEQQTL